MYDIIVIGGGVIGGAILRELSRYNYSLCMVEKENDVCMGQSKANSGIVHGGFDALPGTLKARFNVEGNKMMAEYAKELGVKYNNCGSLVVAFGEEEIPTLESLKKRGEINGVEGLEIISQEKLRKLEPNISDEAVSALFAPTGGIICPYCLTIASIGNAMDNGAKLITNFDVNNVKKIDNGFRIYSSNGQSVDGSIIINAAGAGASLVANAFGDNSFEIKGRRGEYILLDRESGDFISHTIFCTPTAKGKGILMTPTVDHNILMGPTAECIDDFSTDTTRQGLSTIISKANRICKAVPIYNTITSFAGVRAYTDKGDFIIEESSAVKGLINVVGIESPGLTSAPAIGVYVAQIVQEKKPCCKNERFNGIRKPEAFFKDLSVEEKNALIKADPSYGRIICRCEQITEGEIISAIRQNPPATDVDAIKRRTRAGMGRCGGGFCQPHVAEILSKELGLPFTDITKSGVGSELVVAKTK